MVGRKRNYAAEYQRRNELAQTRGFRSYGQQRRYLEVTGQAVQDLSGQVTSQEVQQVLRPPLYDYYSDYSYGNDEGLDVWIIRSEKRGVDPEDAYRQYMQRSRGGKLSHRQLVRLSRDVFGLDWNEQWDTT